MNKYQIQLTRNIGILSIFLSLFQFTLISFWVYVIVGIVFILIANYYDNWPKGDGVLV